MRPVLYRREICSLCDHAQEALRGAGVDAWDAVEVGWDGDLAERFGTRVPVLVRPDTGDELAWPFDPHEGPVLTSVEYRIDPARADEFLPIVQETGRRRMSRGALSAEVFRDTADPGRFVEYIVDESWLEHLRHFDRLTAADELLRARRLSYLLDGHPPKVTRCSARSSTSCSISLRAESSGCLPRKPPSYRSDRTKALGARDG